MASGGYSYGGAGNHGHTQQPYYDPDSVRGHSPQPTPAPSYHSGQNATDYAYGVQHNQNQPGRPSPFDTVFDDNAYPSGSKYNTPGAGTPQPGYYQDTGYYGQAGASPIASRPNLNEDIPLQDRPKGGEANDHIYDAAAAPTSRSRRGKVRVGELGMLGSDKKRIPFVVYLFSLAQLAVFIAEIAKNGMPRKLMLLLLGVSNTASRNLDGLSHHDQATV